MKKLANMTLQKWYTHFLLDVFSSISRVFNKLHFERAITDVFYWNRKERKKHRTEGFHLWKFYNTSIKSNSEKVKNNLKLLNWFFTISVYLQLLPIIWKSSWGRNDDIKVLIHSHVSKYKLFILPKSFPEPKDFCDVSTCSIKFFIASFIFLASLYMPKNPLKSFFSYAMLN